MALTTISLNDVLATERCIGNLTAELPVVPFNHRAIVGSVFIILTLIGLFGNSLVFVAVVISKKLRTITNILVVNLAITDLISCLCFPFMSVGLFSQTGHYPLPDVVCAIVPAILYTCMCCSGSTIAAIAFLRWHVITRSIRTHGFITPKRIVALAMIMWAESIIFMVVPPVIGFGSFGYCPFYSFCCVQENELYKYYSILQSIIIMTVLVIMFTFYALILRHVLRHNKRIRDNFVIVEDFRSANASGNAKSTAPSEESRPSKLKALNKMEVEITKNLFLVVCGLMICVLPQVVNLIIPGRNVLTLYSMMVLSFNSVMNPIIYGQKHPHFKEVFKSLLSFRYLGMPDLD